MRRLAAMIALSLFLSAEVLGSPTSDLVPFTAKSADSPTSAIISPPLELNGNLRYGRETAPLDPWCTYCEGSVVEYLGEYYTVLTVEGDCEEEIAEYQWCALCSLLPDSDPGFDCGDDFFWVSQDSFETENEARGWLDTNGCHSIRCQLEHRVAALGKLDALTRVGDSRGIADLILASEGALWYNAEREAVQGVGCGGLLVLHIPVPADLRATLLSSLSHF